jgi:hypothetical protein
VQPLQTVSAGGTIAVPAGTTKAQAGLAFTARLTWLRPEVRDASGGTIQGKTKRLVNLFLRVLETCRGQDRRRRREGSTSSSSGRSTPMTKPQSRCSPATRRRRSAAALGPDGQATIISDEPLPCMVVAAMPRLELSNR